MYKFRVWEPSREKMHYEEFTNLIHIDYFGNIISNSDCNNIPMLFIDTFNGVEIYEGDIVQFYYHGIKRIEPICKTKSSTYIGRSLNFYFHYIFYEIHNEAKPSIIGNIYKNSNLLL